jgi:hypothetical protein
MTHVWMPPFAQDVFERLGRVIGCGHVSGLEMRSVTTAGRYGDARTCCKSHLRAEGSLSQTAFPDPDLTDHLSLPFDDLLTRPTSL